VETTYLLHLWVVLVLVMVRSQPHHLRHQWPQISTFASLNHIHHHTYFKSPYVHIQVFHILHHHTMKLLQAFESFLLGGSIVENRQQNRFAAGHTIQQQKLICCRPYSLAVKTSSLEAAHIGSKNWFAVGRTIRQRKLFRFRHHNFGSKCHFATANMLLVANTNSLQVTRFRQRITLLLETTQFRLRTQIRCRQHNFGSKTDSLLATQFINKN